MPELDFPVAPAGEQNEPGLTLAPLGKDLFDVGDLLEALWNAGKL